MKLFETECINNEGLEEELTIRGKYEVENIYQNKQYLIHNNDGFEKWYDKKYFK